MKNITVTVDDDLYYRARVRAAERRSTVSAMVREFLLRIVEESSAFEILQREQNELIERIQAAHAGLAASDRLGRDEVHDRDALR